MPSWLADSAFATATWVDVFDICILAWLIYRGLLLIRGTRALLSLVGLLIATLLYGISGYVGLNALHWLLDNLFVYAFLGLLILFQEDIRRALARAGGVFTRSSMPSEAARVESVIQAVFVLAERKIGAIVVMERSGSLEAYVEGSQRLDARISSELIQSIFHPTSPIHDGAIVIRNDRIVAAGVFLPLSLSKDLSKAFGTRHRAAIGLSDATDALVLVVSEERGTVTLVQDGKLTAIVDSNDLRQAISVGLDAPERSNDTPEETAS